ncbi:MAG: hypothetical protein WA131_03380 [Desulfitobacteriaceae bacterium]
MESYLERNSSSLAERAQANDLLLPWRLYVGLFYLGVGLIMYLMGSRG